MRTGSKPRYRKLVAITLSPASIEALKASDNRSQYIDRLLEHYPPQPVASVNDVARLVREQHPWAVHPSSRRDTRSDLPSFGGEPPLPHPKARAVSWSESLVCDEYGVVWPREHWQRHAAESMPCKRP